MKRFYITTPLYYVNDKPHIGHAYTTILADVISRYNQLIGNEVFFLTGTDEHGQKVQEAAEKSKTTPEKHVEKYHKNFVALWKKLNINYDKFIRTTDKPHIHQGIFLHFPIKNLAFFALFQYAVYQWFV